MLTTCWEQVSQDLMNEAIDQWLDRISLVIALKEDILNIVCNNTALHYLICQNIYLIDHIK